MRRYLAIEPNGEVVSAGADQNQESKVAFPDPSKRQYHGLLGNRCYLSSSSPLVGACSGGRFVALS